MDGATQRSGIEIDESDLPLLRVAYRGLPDEQTWKDHFVWLSDFVRREQRFAAVVDVRQGGQTIPTHRRQFAEWLKRDWVLVKRHSLGAGVIVANPMQRGLITAVTWLVPMPNPIKVVSTPTDAEVFARKCLRQAGLESG